METKTKTRQSKSLAKGLVAGLVGGLVGMLAMAAAERLTAFRRRKVEEPAEPPKPTLDTMHWSFGAAVGAAYGVAAEYFPAATAKEGVTFGLALEAFAHEGTLPALGLLTGSASHDSPSEITSHVVYGVTTEVVRSFVRKRL